MSGEELLERYAVGVRHFGEVDLHGADLKGAELSGIDLTGADLCAANLSKAKLSGAILRGADLIDAILRCTDLRGADLVNADLSCSDLTGANLAGADIREADFSGSILVGTTLTDTTRNRGTNLYSTDLSRALTDIDPTSEDLRGLMKSDAMMEGWDCIGRWMGYGFFGLLGAMAGGALGILIGLFGGQDTQVLCMFGGALFGAVWVANKLRSAQESANRVTVQVRDDTRR